MNAPKPMQSAEEEASADVQALAAVIEYFDTHDFADELAALPEVRFEVTAPCAAE